MTPEEQRAFIVQHLLAGNPKMQGDAAPPDAPPAPPLWDNPLLQGAGRVVQGDPQANIAAAGALAYPAKQLVAAIERDIANTKKLGADVKASTGATLTGTSPGGMDLVTGMAAPLVAKALRGAPAVTGKAAPKASEIVGDRKLFDYRRLEDVPDVPQTALPRYEPPRGVSERMQDALSDRRLRQGVEKGVDAGIKEGAHVWYNTEPLRLAYVERLGEKAGNEAFKQYMSLVAATSPGSRVPVNIKIASYYADALRRGATPELPAKGSGYGSKAQNLHLQNVERYAGGKWDPLQNPKPISFAENLSGNWAPATVDTHAFRPFGILTKDPRFLKTGDRELVGTNKKGEDIYRNIYPRKMFESGEITMADALKRPAFWEGMPNPNEYAAAERFFQDLGARKGLPGAAPAQASSWVGLRKQTGMDSPPLPFLPIFEDVVTKSADAYGVTPQKMLDMFIRRGAPFR